MPSSALGRLGAVVVVSAAIAAACIAITSSPSHSPPAILWWRTGTQAGGDGLVRGFYVEPDGAQADVFVRAGIPVSPSMGRGPQSDPEAGLIAVWQGHDLRDRLLGREQLVARYEILDQGPEWCRLRRLALWDHLSRTWVPAD